MENNTLTPTAQDLIDEIGGAFVDHQCPPADSFTLSDFIALKNATSETTAYRYLERLVLAGKLCKVKIGRANYYYRIGGA